MLNSVPGNTAQLRQPRPYAVSELSDLTVSAGKETVQHLYGAQSVVGIIGPPNVSKTAFGIDQSLHVAAGEPWFNLKVRSGPVIYIAAEAPGSVKMRAKAAAERKFPDRRLPFYVVQDVPQLGDNASNQIDAQRILDTVAHVQSVEGAEVKLVVIDTLASCMGDGDENSDGMMRLVAAAKHIAVSADCAVMLIHHPSKGDGASARGHGSFAAACDCMLTISADEKSGIRVAKLTKSRDSATGLQFAYKLDEVTLEQPDSFGDPRTTIIVRPVAANEIPRERPQGSNQRKLLDELERRHRGGETGWDRAGIHQAAKPLGFKHRNSGPAALKGLIKGGFVGGSDAHLTLKYPPEDCT